MYKVIRVITVAPVLALAMAGVVAWNCGGVFPSAWNLAYSMFFLGVLPLLAYPLQKYIPAYKDKGREGQRNLAIIFAAAGFTIHHESYNAYVDYKEKEADWEKRYGGDNPKGYKESLYERLKNQSERTTEYRQQNADKNKGRGAR